MRQWPHVGTIRNASAEARLSRHQWPADVSADGLGAGDVRGRGPCNLGRMPQQADRDDDERHQSLLRD